METAMIRFFTFSQFHNKVPPAGSTHIRVMQLLKYWPDAQLYEYGENPDVLIFQKVYMAQDYQFPAHFEGIKILDICDPDWLEGVAGIKRTIDVMDAVTVSSPGLLKFVRQITDKPVVHIPDRFDLSPLPKPKLHITEAKTVAWFGYRHNAETLRYAMPLINELGLNLVVVSDDDPMAWQWIPGQPGDDFRHSRYKFLKHHEETIYRDLQRADFCVLPFGTRPIDPFKSNNKTIRAIMAGLPVAHDAEQVKGFMNPGVRNDYLEMHYATTLKEYDVKRSVAEYKDLIEQIKGTRDA
jgi:hypothetical protein